MPPKPEVTVVGRRLDPDHYRLRDFLTRAAQPYRWVEADSEEAAQILATHGIEALPAVVEQDGTVHAPASVELIVDRWRMNAGPEHDSYDLVIVGAGPAGLAAAVYAASDGLRTLVLEEDVPGGQAAYTSMIENFFGFPEGIPGPDLVRRAGRQAEKFGAELLIRRGARGSRWDGDGFVIAIDDSEVRASTAIAAPGMQWRRHEAEGVEELLGRGVYYGAGKSEARQCSGEPVAVVGAGNSAGQAVMHLADEGADVVMLVRGDGLGRSMSQYLVDRIEHNPRIDVRFHTEVAGVEAEDGHLRAVRTRAGDELPARSLFLCLGGVPRTGWAPSAGVATDPSGFILTGRDLGGRPEGWPLDRDPLPLETSVPGLFAAGDVRHDSPKRVGSAVGDGTMATALVHRRLAEL